MNERSIFKGFHISRPTTGYYGVNVDIETLWVVRDFGTASNLDSGYK